MFLFFIVPAAEVKIHVVHTPLTVNVLCLSVNCMLHTYPSEVCVCSTNREFTAEIIKDVFAVTAATENVAEMISFIDQQQH